ncbi:hypothetical protein GGF46_003580 [Coemansia sp. RSA 552]|nr:hypothetical protein GGF46_003580 [Coemansia sp. RSA 552]
MSQLAGVRVPAAAKVNSVAEEMDEEGRTGRERSRSQPPIHRAAAPAGWDTALTEFLERLSSEHQIGVEQLAVWHDELGRLRVPGGDLAAADAYVEFIGRRLGANARLTGNVGWAMVHFVAGVRRLRTVDFQDDVEPALCALAFVVRVALRGLCLAKVGLRRALVDRAAASGAAELLCDKAAALDDDGVRARAYRQTMGDSDGPRYAQALRYAMLALGRLDVRRGDGGALWLHRQLLALVSDILADTPLDTEISADSDRDLLAQELVCCVGPSTAFDVHNSLADEVVRALLLVAIDAPRPAARGLVRSAYTYLFARQTDESQAHLIEHESALVLLLLASQRVEDNAFLAALARVRDAPGDVLDERAVSFGRLFDRLAGAALDGGAWAALLHTLVARNDAFRAYALARTDSDTLIVPLLTRLSATAEAEPTDPRVYLWLGTLAQLTADARFVEQLQRIDAHTVRLGAAAAAGEAGAPNLAELVAMVLADMVQRNLAAARDSHIHALALAALANTLNARVHVMAPLAQRLVRLVRALQRRLAACAPAAPAYRVCADALAALLAALCRLAHTDNPHVVYALLQAREVLAAAREGPAAAALRLRIAYFHARVAALSAPQPPAILDLIRDELAHGRPPADPPRVDFDVAPPPAPCWSGFMLRLVRSVQP